MLAGERRRARRAAWGLGLLLAVGTAFAPLVYPLTAVLGALAAVAFGRRRRVSLGRSPRRPAGAAVPVELELFRPPGAVLLEAGINRPDLVNPRLSAESLLLLSPGGPGTPPLWVTGGLLAAALGALLLRRNRMLVAVGWGVALFGMLVAILVSRLPLSLSATEDTTPWPGVALAFASTAVLLSAATAAQSFSDLWRLGWHRRLFAATVALLALTTPVSAAGLWMWHGVEGPLTGNAPPSLPPFLESVSADGTQPRTLVIAPREDGAVSYTVLRGRPPRLGEPQIPPDPAVDARLGEVVAALVAGRGGDEAAALADFGIRYLVVPAPTVGDSVDRTLVDTVDALPGLERLQLTEDFALWRLLEETGRLRIVPPGEDAEPTVLASGPVEAAVEIPPVPRGAVCCWPNPPGAVGGRPWTAPNSPAPPPSGECRSSPCPPQGGQTGPHPRRTGPPDLARRPGGPGRRGGGPGTARRQDRGGPAGTGGPAGSAAPTAARPRRRRSPPRRRGDPSCGPRPPRSAARPTARRTVHVRLLVENRFALLFLVVVALAALFGAARLPRRRCPPPERTPRRCWPRWSRPHGCAPPPRGRTAGPWWPGTPPTRRTGPPTASWTSPPTSPTPTATGRPRRPGSRGGTSRRRPTAAPWCAPRARSPPEPRSPRPPPATPGHRGALRRTLLQHLVRGPRRHGTGGPAAAPGQHRRDAGHRQRGPLRPRRTRLLPGDPGRHGRGPHGGWNCRCCPWWSTPRRSWSTCAPTRAGSRPRCTRSAPRRAPTGPRHGRPRHEPRRPGVPGGGGNRRLVVAAVSDEPTTAQVRLLTPDGEVTAETLAEVEVPPAASARVSLEGPLESRDATLVVTADHPVVVGVSVRRSDDDTAHTAATEPLTVGHGARAVAPPGPEDAETPCCWAPPRRRRR